MLEDFVVFQLATQLYQRCKQIRVPLFLKDQLMRASASVAMNLAEGSGKFSPKDQRRYYSISLGSLREVQAVLALEKVEDRKIRLLADQIGAILFTLCRSEPAENRGILKTAPEPAPRTAPETELQTAQTPNAKLPTEN
jgi:four helix bundle protein